MLGREPMLALALLPLRDGVRPLHGLELLTTGVSALDVQLLHVHELPPDDDISVLYMHEEDVLPMLLELEEPAR